MVALAKDIVEFFQVMEKVTGPDFRLYVHRTRIGGVLIEWQDAAQEHELEIDPDGSLNLLHIDRATGVMVEEKFLPHRAVSHLATPGRPSLVGIEVAGLREE